MTEGVSLAPPDLDSRRERQKPSHGAAPEDAWRDLRRRFRLLWILLAASLPGTFVPALLLGDLIPRNAALPVIGLLWAAAVARAGWDVARFACPRCGLAFFENWVFLKILRDRCTHCELRRYAVDVAPPRAPGGSGAARARGGIRTSSLAGSPAAPRVPPPSA